MKPRNTVLPYLVLGGIVVVTIGAAIILPKQIPMGCQHPTVVSTVSAVRFRDTGNGTSLTLQVNPQLPHFGQFRYSTAQGSLYQGEPVKGLQPSGASHDLITCAGLLQVTFAGSGILTDATQATSQAQVQLSAIINLTHYTASITFHDLSHNQSFTTTTNPPVDEAHTVTQFDTDFVQKNWTSLYQLTSSALTQGETAAQFATTLTAQEQKSGTVTNIVDLTPPQIGSNPAGIVYFTLNQQLTVQLKGVPQTQIVTSVFVLENGAWRYWFSQKA